MSSTACEVNLMTDTNPGALFSIDATVQEDQNANNMSDRRRLIDLQREVRSLRKVIECQDMQINGLGRNEQINKMEREILK